MKRSMYSVEKYLLAALVLCAPLAAQAVEGWVVDDISLQAGPDPAYPSITEIQAGTPVSIQGCIRGWTWCDVVVGADRGWVPGTFLEEDYGGQRVVVIDYGPRIGIPVVGFSLGVYWDQHYHSRPFYTQRQQWVSKTIQPGQPPRPAKSVARTTQPQSGSTATQAAAGTPQHQQQQLQQPTRSQQQTSTATAAQQQSSSTTRQTTTARAKAPQRPETAPQPEAGKQPSQVEKRQSAPEQTTMAKAKPRAGEPKPKDELKNPKPKDKQQQQQDSGGGTDGGQH